MASVRWRSSSVSHPKRKRTPSTCGKGRAFEMWESPCPLYQLSGKIKKISTTSGELLSRCVIIATGGGAILREENVDALRENGRVYFIDRPLDSILPTDDRPLSSTRETLIQRYNERYYIYRTTCDKHIKAACTAEKVAEKILTEFAK